MRVLYFTQVWPEPRSSAAGLRSWNIVRALRASPFELVVASAASNEAARLELEEAGIRTRSVSLNRSEIDEWVRVQAPDAVIFDRFLLEEQFGARVALACPQAARILDTIDLHFLRRSRQAGRADWRGEDAYRELASIYRCDHSWLVSDFEESLLVNEAEVPAELVSVSRLSPAAQPSIGFPFEERQHFVSIGNFRHPPNHDSAVWMRQEIWPLIRQKLTGAELHLYGAYPSREVTSLHAPKEGFFVEGPAEHAVETLAQYRVTLAPLRFGAGIKGKVLDGWCAGTPVVTTPVGAEGMTGGRPFPGAVESEPEALASQAVALHEDSAKWNAVRSEGLSLLKALYGAEGIESDIRDRVLKTVQNRDALRARNLTGRLLELATTRSTLYFSRWIEAKEKLNEARASLAE